MSFFPLNTFKRKMEEMEKYPMVPRKTKTCRDHFADNEKNDNTLDTNVP